MRKGILVAWIVGATVVAGLVFWGFRPTPLAVEVEPMVRGPLRVTVDEDGQTRVRRRYEISAPVSGTLLRIEREVGDAVEAGDVITTIQPPAAAVLDPRTRAELEARVVAAHAALDRARESREAARSAAELAASELQRSRSLRERGSLTASELDEAEAAARRASAEERAAEHAVEVARAELAGAEAAVRGPLPSEDGSDGPVAVPVVVPVDGQVLALARKSAGPVRAGEPLLVVGDTADLEVIVDVLSPDAVRIRPGAPVELERWGGGEPLLGRVRSVEPVAFTDISALGVEEQRVFVVIDFVSPREEWEGLGDAYRVEASIVIWQADSVLQVPSSALFRRGNGWGAFVLGPEGDRVTLRDVETGHWAGLHVEVEGGLEEGQHVVVHPPDELGDGSKVEILTVASAKKPSA